MNTTRAQAGLSEPLRRKRSECERILRELERVVVAFSGGADSTLLLALAAETLGPGNVLAAVGVSASLPRRELEAARKLARRVGVEMAEVPTGELRDDRYAANPPDRCYFCKSALFGELEALRRARAFGALASGANADDAGDFRPGLRAGRECGVRNPLMEAGITKADVRELSRAMGLPTWDKPAMACLASRVPYGRSISSARLGRVEQAEQLLHDLGFREVRVRDHHPVARVEVPVSRFADLLAARGTVLAGLRQVGFVYVCLDLAGLRSGSMNEALPPGAKAPAAADGPADARR